MGASIENGRSIHQAKDDRLRFAMKISIEQLQNLKLLVNERSNFKYPHLCAVERVQNYEDNVPNIFCQNYHQVIIWYEPYDCLLSDLKHTFPLQQVQIERIIYSVCSALTFLEQRKYRHGDISTEMICRYKNQWKLVDNYFINGGITAYEKVLEGKEGFLSPAQMDKIRHGFVRESPSIEESDDIFALGMTCLELMTGRPSRLCYKQSHIRFNQDYFSEAISIVQTRYPPAFADIIFAMLNLSEQKRIPIKAILSHPSINRHMKKFSLKGFNQK